MNHKLTFLFNFRCEVSKIPQARFLNSPPVAPDLPVAQTSSKSASGCEGTESDGKTHVRLISPKPPSCPPSASIPTPPPPSLSLHVLYPVLSSPALLPCACTREMQVTWMQRCGPLRGGAHARRHARTQLPGPGPPLVRASPSIICCLLWTDRVCALPDQAGRTGPSRGDMADFAVPRRSQGRTAQTARTRRVCDDGETRGER